MSVGWAVVDGGEVNIRTVSDTRRAAIVNWLVVAKNVLITRGTTDDHIEQVWHQYRGHADAQRVEIKILRQETAS